MRRRGVSFGSLAIMLAGALASCSDSPPNSVSPTTVATPERAAWAVQSDDGPRMFVRMLDARGAVVGTSATDIVGGDITNPDWSPDGTRLVVAANDGHGHDDLWVSDPDGGPSVMLFDCEDECEYFDDPAWSPDGSRVIACEMVQDGSDHLGSLVAVDVASRQVVTLWRGDRLDVCAGPRWSPDGASVVMELGRRTNTSFDFELGGVSLVVLDAAAGSIRTLTDPALYAATADWNRAGDLIVYSALTAPGAQVAQLFVIAPDGSRGRQLTFAGDVPSGAVEPAFTGDGAAVVFATGDAAALMAVDLRTGAVSPAFETPALGHHPRARPPGA